MCMRVLGGRGGKGLAEEEGEIGIGWGLNPQQNSTAHTLQRLRHFSPRAT